MRDARNKTELFHFIVSKLADIDSILPTQAALLQHAKLAAYQAGVIWSQSTLSHPEAQESYGLGQDTVTYVWMIF